MKTSISSLIILLALFSGACASAPPSSPLKTPVVEAFGEGEWEAHILTPYVIIARTPHKITTHRLFDKFNGQMLWHVMVSSADDRYFIWYTFVKPEKPDWLFPIDVLHTYKKHIHVLQEMYPEWKWK